MYSTTSSGSWGIATWKYDCAGAQLRSERQTRAWSFRPLSMMSFPPQTPPKVLPGAYIQTPALSRFQSASSNTRPLGSSSQQQYGSYTSDAAVSRPPQQQQVHTNSDSPSETLLPIERAAKNISEMLNQEAQYPDLDSYIGRKWLSRNSCTRADFFTRRYLIWLWCLTATGMGAVSEI